MEVPNTLTLETSMSADELREKLKTWEPWRHEICFSNGVKTSECQIGKLYSDRPLGKLRRILEKFEETDLRGGRALDIGCNSGYNSIYLAGELDMSVTGIDVTNRHLEVSRFLATFVNDGHLLFEKHDATTYSAPGEFDLILHLGTLYHLPNPLLSLENTARNLKAGGYLALETSCYTGSEDAQCRWIRGINNDNTDFWALSKRVLTEVLEMYGFNNITLVSETQPLRRPWAMAMGLSRVLYLAQK